MTHPKPDSASATALSHPNRSKLVPATLGIVLGLVCVSALVMFIRRDGLPELTREMFDEAVARWESAAPENYDIETRVEGRQPAAYRVEVRDGRVGSATRNGNPLTQLRTLGTWSVPGMFGTIETDVMHMESVANGTANPRSPKLLLRAQFDPTWGYPAQYHRIQWGSHFEVFWEVTHFEVDPG